MIPTPCAWILQGGWQGHAPATVASIFAANLQSRGFSTQVFDSLEPLEDAEKLALVDLVIPLWTMGSISEPALRNLLHAVRAGTGLGGVHGGMCDAFRGAIDYNWMTGGQFLGHPHVGPYTICRTAESSAITEALPEAFTYDSEQYYMMVDPAVRVLADTVYFWDDTRVRMPVVWTRSWGAGRVFFSALGHQPEEFTRSPEVLEMSLRGLVWACRKR
jgi:uncharacterized protein